MDQSKQLEVGAAAVPGDLLENIVPLRAYLKAVARRRLGGSLQAQVDESDIVQEALQLAAQHYHELRGQTAEEKRGWLIAIVRHQAENARRFHGQQKRDVSRQRRLAAGSGPGCQPADGQLTPCRATMSREEAARIAAALERLPPDFRRIIELKFWDGLAHDAVAAEVGLTRDQVRSRLAEGLRRLRMILEGKS